MTSTERMVPRELDGSSVPSVSVVIPCYNYARYLPEAVNSVRGQTGVRTDIIIVDDASTDDSLDVARRLADQDPSVQVLSHRVNQGPVRTFNDGLARVRGTYLVRLDADDLLTPGSLARSTAVGEARPDVGLVYGHPVHFADGRRPNHARQTVRGWTVWYGRTWLADRCSTGLNVITSPEVLMRSSVVQAVGGQRPLAHTHDMEMWLRLAAFSNVARVDGPDQAWHREHPFSLSHQLGDSVESLLQRRAAFDTLFAGAAGNLPEAQDLLERSRKALAEEALDSACRTFDRNRYDSAYVDRLVAFATDAYSRVGELRQSDALRRRMELGPAGVRRRPWYLGRAIIRRLSEERRYLRWNRTGVYGA